MISSGAGVSLAFLLLIAFFVWGMVCSCKPVKRQAVDPEKIRLIRDTVVSGRVEYDDDNSYFLSFRELGELEVPRKEDEHLRLRRRPGYATTKIGDAFLSALEFVIRYCPPDLQKEAEAEYTPRQKKLSALLRDLQKSDDTRKKHRKAVNKVIHIFRREQDE